MISGIGINPFQGSTAVGAGRDVSAPNSEPEKAADEKTARPAADPVPVKPANIGGGSAIAAQAEASQPKTDQDTGKNALNAPAKPADDTDAAGLSEEERAEVKKLAARDREVRAHEAAHQAVGGQYAGAASFSYQSGPDGRRYAVGGEVPIDIGSVPGDPDATVRKLRTVRRAALAPVEPSAQDRSVAATAEAGVRRAQADKRAAVNEERRSGEEATAQSQPNGPSKTGDAAPESSAQPALAAKPPIAREIPGDRKE